MNGQIKQAEVRLEMAIENGPDCFDPFEVYNAARDLLDALQQAEETEQSIKADAYDMIVEQLSKAGALAPGGSAVDTVTRLVEQQAEGRDTEESALAGWLSERGLIESCDEPLSMDDLIQALTNHEAEITKADGREAVAPLAWIRYGSDGSIHGPILDRYMDDLKRASSGWEPLYAQPQQPAPSVGVEGVAMDAWRVISDPENCPDWSLSDCRFPSAIPSGTTMQAVVSGSRAGISALRKMLAASKQPTDTERSIVYDNDLYYFLTNIANGIDTVCQSAEASNFLVRIDKERAAIDAAMQGEG